MSARFPLPAAKVQAFADTNGLPPKVGLPPAIGSHWPGQGGIYAGLVRGRDGQPDAHLIVATARPAARLAWKLAIEWARGVQADGHTDFTLPTRFESAVLFGNVGELFEPNWYWTRTEYEHDGSYAWFQYFDYGSQFYYHKSCEGRAVAVRRLLINPSVLSTHAADATPLEQAA